MLKYKYFFLLILLSGCTSSILSRESIENDVSLEKELEEQIAVYKLSEAAYNFIRGELELDEGNFADALAFYEEAIKKDSTAAPMLRGRLVQLYIKEGKLLRALEEVELGLEVEPDNISLLKLKAGVFSAQNKIEDSKQVYLKILDLNPQINVEDVYVLLASLYLKSNEADKAKETIEKLLLKNPFSFVANYYHAKLLELSGETEKAEVIYQKTLSLNPNSSIIVFDLVRLLLKKDKPAAIKLLQNLIASDPSNTEARNILSKIFLQESRYDEAIKELERIRDEDNNPTEVRLKIALIKLQKRDYASAKEDLSLILASFPDRSDARFYLSSALAANGELIQSVKEAKKIKPNQKFYVESRIFGGLILQKLNKLDEAIELIKAALEEKSNELKLILTLANIYRDKKQYKEAIKLLKQAIEIEPKTERNFFMLGMLFDDTRQTDKAVEQMKKVLEINPNNPNALNYIAFNIANENKKLDKLDEAKDLITRAINLQKDNGYFIDTLGWIYFKKGDYTQALEHLERAKQLVPNDPVILEHLAKVKLALKQYREAMIILRRAMDLATDSGDEEQVKQLETSLAEATRMLN